MSSVALLTNNPFVTDYRVWKLARSLADAGFQVTVVARPGEGLPARERQAGFEVVRLAQPAPRWAPAPRLPGAAPAGRGPVALLRETAGRAAQAARFLFLARSWAARIAREVPAQDTWISEALISLPVALDLRRRLGGRVVHDAPDLDVESARFALLPEPWRRLLQWRERRWIRAADGLVTASRPYAAVLARATGRSPVVVHNGPLISELRPAGRRVLHEALGLDPATQLILAFGQIVPGRGLEALVDAMPLVPGAHLAIVGHGSLAEPLRARAAASAAAGRIHVLGPVPPAEIPAVTASADVAAMPIQPTTLNHRLTAPTKLFDAMGAGVPVVATDLEGMGAIVRETGCGELCRPDDPADLARAIRAVLDAPPARRAAYGEAGRRAIESTYGWERQVPVLLDLLRDLGVAP